MEQSKIQNNGKPCVEFLDAYFMRRRFFGETAAHLIALNFDDLDATTLITLLVCRINFTFFLA